MHAVFSNRFTKKPSQNRAGSIYTPGKSVHWKCNFSITSSLLRDLPSRPCTPGRHSTSNTVRTA
jgi:hypothetical protein